MRTIKNRVLEEKRRYLSSLKTRSDQTQILSVMKLWTKDMGLQVPDMSKYANAKEMEERYRETLKQMHLDRTDKLHREIRNVILRA